MRLLFDQNVSPYLVGMCSVEDPESRHVTDVGLDTSTDAEIWIYAGEHGFVIVSKDSDFRQLAFRRRLRDSCLEAMRYPNVSGWLRRP